MLMGFSKKFPVLLLLPLFPCVFWIIAQPQVKPPEGNTDSYGVASCQRCHEKIVASFMETAHFRTSSLADAHSIKGSFSEGQNVLRTRSEATYFKMERRLSEGEDAFYQTAYQSTESGVKSRTEQIDLVIGSGRKGRLAIGELQSTREPGLE